MNIMPMVASLARDRHLTLGETQTEVSKAVILRDDNGAYHLCPLLTNGHTYLRAIKPTRNGRLVVGGITMGVVEQRSGVHGWFNRLVKFNDKRTAVRAIALVTFFDGEYRISLIHQEAYAPCVRAIERDEYSERMHFVAKAGLEGTVVFCRAIKT